MIKKLLITIAFMALPVLAGEEKQLLPKTEEAPAATPMSQKEKATATTLGTISFGTLAVGFYTKSPLVTGVGLGGIAGTLTAVIKNRLSGKVLIGGNVLGQAGIAALLAQFFGIKSTTGRDVRGVPMPGLGQLPRARNVPIKSTLRTMIQGRPEAMLTILAAALPTSAFTYYVYNYVNQKTV